MTLSKDLNRQICDYDFEWVEGYLKRRLPPVFKLLYITGKVFTLENIIVDEDSLYMSVAYWQPQNEASYRHAWPGTENRLIIAQTGAGDQFHAFPSEEFREVYFFDHETGECKDLGIDIPNFVSKVEQEYVRDMAETLGWQIRSGV